MGLREDIKCADSEDKITELLTTGNSYKYASTRTKNSWKSTAKFRLCELNNFIPAQTPPTPVKPPKKNKK